MDYVRCWLKVVCSSQIRRDRGCQKELMNLKLDCPFVQEGCDWKLQQFMEFEVNCE